MVESALYQKRGLTLTENLRLEPYKLMCNFPNEIKKDFFIFF